MNKDEIEERFRGCIDQWFHTCKHLHDAEEKTLWYIGGVLKAALFILPNDRYFALKQYCFDKHGYNPGGVDTGQYEIDDYVTDEWKEEKWTTKTKGAD